jgi:hypothetical protein
MTTFTIPTPEWVSRTLLDERGTYAGFQMYSTEGNDAVGEMLTRVFAEAEHSKARRLDVINAVLRGVQDVARTHPEVHDTEPEHAIVDAVNAYFDREGWVHVWREDVC